MKLLAFTGPDVQKELEEFVVEAALGPHNCEAAAILLVHDIERAGSTLESPASFAQAFKSDGARRRLAAKLEALAKRLRQPT